MSYTDHPGCAQCECPLTNAQASALDAPWRSCACRCHDTARQVILNDPLTKELQP